MKENEFYNSIIRNSIRVIIYEKNIFERRKKKVR